MGTYVVKEDTSMAENSTEKKKNNKPKKGKPRIHLLDELRGFAIFCMVFYHGFYTVGVFFGWKWGVDMVNFFAPAEPFFAALFIFISGISSNLSHSNIERGAKLFFIAYIVTVVTYFAVGDPGTIRFGILHMLSVCMMFFGVFSPIIKKIPYPIGLVVNILLFIFTFDVIRGSVGVPFLWSLELPAFLYKTDFLYPFGFLYPGFTSGDYFPLLPWLFMFMAGGFFGRLAVQKKFPKFTYKKHVPFFAFLGRHALLIYILHQPIIFGLCTAVNEIIKLTAK